MIIPENLTGRRFGKLVVLKRGERVGLTEGPWWLCRCDCGRLKNIPGHSLRGGRTKSCGECGYKKQRNQERNTIHMEGQRFGRLVVLELAKDQPGDGSALWKCQCDCGNICYVTRESLQRGFTRTCGCYDKEIRTKWVNDDERRAANIFHNMKQRCYNPTDSNFPRWGSKGIDICPEWLADNKAFVEWSMKNGYREGYSIDRIDNSKGYSPDNCRWVPMVVQGNNRSNNRILEYEGLSMTVAEWARNLDVPVHQLYKMSDEEILSYIVARS